MKLTFRAWLSCMSVAVGVLALALWYASKDAALGTHLFLIAILLQLYSIGIRGEEGEQERKAK